MMCKTLIAGSRNLEEASLLIDGRTFRGAGIVEGLDPISVGAASWRAVFKTRLVRR